jgi:hypothetical protein
MSSIWSVLYAASLEKITSAKCFSYVFIINNRQHKENFMRWLSLISKAAIENLDIGQAYNSCFSV